MDERRNLSTSFLVGLTLVLISVSNAQTVYESVFMAAGLGTPADVRATVAADKDVNQAGDSGLTPLVAALLVNPDLAVAEELLVLGADVNARNPGGMTALMFAAQGHENTRWIELLLRYGADPSLQDVDGKTAADHLGQNPHLRGPQVAELLSPNRPISTPPTADSAATRNPTTPSENQAVRSGGVLEPRWTRRSWTAVREEVERLESQFMNVAILLYSDGGTNARYIIAVTLPPRFPNPATPVRGEVVCDTGVLEAEDPELWQSFLEASGATLDGSHFAWDDIAVVCSDEGRVMVRTTDFYRTIALVDANRQWDQMPFGTRALQPFDLQPALTFAFNPAGWVAPTNPSVFWHHDTPAVFMREDGTIGSSWDFEVVGVDPGDGLVPIRFDGEVHNQTYNLASGPILVVVKHEDYEKWSQLLVNPDDASLTWWRSETPPQ